MIKDNLILNYDETDVRFPCGLCNTHRRSLDYLKKSESGEETRETHFGFEKLSLYLKSDVKLKRRALLDGLGQQHLGCYLIRP